MCLDNICIGIYYACMASEENRKLTPSDLESHIGYWMRRVSNHVSHTFRQRLESHGVTVAEWVALRSLYMLEPCSVTDLAEQMGMDRGAASRLADRLLKKGMATRVTAASDRRYVELELTHEGQSLVPVLAHEADLNDEHFFAQLPTEDMNALLRILQTLVEQHGIKVKPTE